jgi:uncharacterized protein (TIGR02246 family)
MSDETATVTQRLLALEQHVRHLSDELEIYRLIASYGPAVDSGDYEAAANLWANDGVFDTDGGCLNGREAVRDMLREAAQQELIQNGSAHVPSSPLVRVTGDTAVATCYSQLYGRSGPRCDLLRVAVNFWRFERIDGAWSVKHRVNRLIAGPDHFRSLTSTPQVTQ